MVQSLSASSAASLPPTTEALYESQFDFVWNNLRRLGVPDAQLEDAVHDVFGVVHRRRHTFDGSSRVQTWLYGIVRRVASNHRRGEQRHRRRLSAVRDQPCTYEPAEDSFVRRQMLRLVQSFVGQLDPPKREVFVLAHLEQMSGREISQLLDVNPNTASARLRAARSEFAEFIRAHDLDADDATRIAQGESGPEPAKRRVLLGLVPVFGGIPQTTAPAASSGRWALALSASAVVAAVTLGIVATVAQPPQIHTDPPPGNGATPMSYEPSEPSIPALEPASIAADATSSMQVDQPQPAASTGSFDPTTASDASPATVESLPGTTEAAKQGRHRATPRNSAAVTTGKETTASDLAEQTRLARSVSASKDAATTLRRVQRYQERFPNGFFAERLAFEGLAALCALKRDGEARRQVANLRSRYPTSSLLPSDPKVPCGKKTPAHDTKIQGAGDTRD